MKKFISIILVILMLTSSLVMFSSALSYKEEEAFTYNWLEEEQAWEVDGIRSSYENSIGYNTYKIPSSYDGSPIIGIAEEAFAKSKVSKIILADTIQYIEKNAFRGCEKLNTVCIPASVTYISRNAFNVSKHFTILYQGTKSQWSALVTDFTEVDLYYMSVYCNYDDGCYHLDTDRFDAVASTCYKLGREAYTYCNDCESIVGGGADIPMKNHTYNIFVWVDETTCTTDGLYYYKCSNDGCTSTSDYRVQSAMGHDSDGDWDGYCDRCGFDMTVGCEHEDTMHRGKCNKCHKDFTKECGHACHLNNGNGNGWYRFCLFFWRLFKFNRECKCGYYHY